MNELLILIPEEKIKLRNNVSLIMFPCRVKQLKEILGVISKYIDKIAENDDIIELAKFLLADSGEQGLKDIYLVLGNCVKIPEKVFDSIVKESLVSENSDDREDHKDESTKATKNKKPNRTTIFFDSLFYDELLLLLVKFLEMNKDFFKRIGEKMKPQPQEVKEESPQNQKTGASK